MRNALLESCIRFRIFLSCLVIPCSASNIKTHISVVLIVLRVALILYFCTKEIALDFGIPVYTTQSIKNDQITKELLRRVVTLFYRTYPSENLQSLYNY